jgi:hypothetical protein
VYTGDGTYCKYYNYNQTHRQGIFSHPQLKNIGGLDYTKHLKSHHQLQKLQKNQSSRDHKITPEPPNNTQNDPMRLIKATFYCAVRKVSSYCIFKTPASAQSAKRKKLTKCAIRNRKIKLPTTPNYQILASQIFTLKRQSSLNY